MSSSDNIVTITIFDRIYHIKCAASESLDLQESARYLDAEIRKMNQSQKTHNAERLAVIAALNIAHELLVFKNEKNRTIDLMHAQIKSLQHRIQTFLEIKEEVTL